MEMLAANLTLLMSSIIAATFLAMYQWRYVVPNNYFNAAKVTYETETKKNWWKWAQMIFTYGFFGIYSFGALFQLIGIFGVATKANAGIWDWLVHRVGQLAALTYLTFMFLAYNDTMKTSATMDTVRPRMIEEIVAFLTIFGGMTAVFAFVQRPWR